MNCTLNNVLIFTAGAFIGSVVTWRLLNEKYERIVQEETKDIKERFSKRLNEMEDKHTYENLTNRYSGEQQGKNEVKEERKEVEPMDDIRVISPEEYGDNIDEYEPVSLTYYADGVLADEMDEPIDDIESVVGDEALHTFGEYENDSVFVRNNYTKRDYEILRDTRAYSEVKKLYNPRMMED